jgi:small GTP-binding protein
MHTLEAKRTMDAIEKKYRVDFNNLDSLKRLKRVYLSDANLLDISVLKDCKNLASLDLSNNRIEDISILKGLEHLTHLNVTKNKIKSLSSLQNLQNLSSLNLSHNQIACIEPLKELSKLTSLDISYNRIKDITPIQGLKALTYCNAAFNSVKTFPKSLLSLALDVHTEWHHQGVVLKENPIEEPPLEIVSQGKEGIKVYFNALRVKESRSRKIYELKVLFVGDGGAGKSSLIRRILDDEFDDKERMTHGIEIHNHELSIEEKSLRARFWDFGGQHMMHATHQFFLSHRSLYILVLDGRKEEDSQYWLNFIQSFGGDSPILIVLNKMDDNQGFELNRKFLKEKYPNIIDFYKLSCLTKEGLESFYNGMKKAMLEVEFIHTTWASHWLDIKNEIEALEESFISKKDFERICSKHGVSDAQTQKVLSSYLDSLGVAIHFSDDKLKGIHALKPEWITNGVYGIITSNLARQNRGVIAINSLPKLLDSALYPPSTHQYIINLMKKFGLCYSLNDEEILLPSLLDVEEKPFVFDYSNALRFELKYSFLPKSIIAMFIVQSQQEIKEGLLWRTGVVLENLAFHSSAVVRVDEEDKRIDIYVDGERAREFLTVIRTRFHEIHQSFQKIGVVELVPLPKFPKESIEYLELLGYEKAQRDDYFHGRLGRVFSVSKLLDGLEKKEHHQKVVQVIYNTQIIHGDNILGDKNAITVEGDNLGVINQGDQNSITLNN